MSCHKSAGGETPWGERAACVETEPADPQQACADKAEDYAMRRHSKFGISEALAEIECADECRDAGGDVDYCATGEVKRRESATERSIKQAALPPNHVSHGIVNEKRPEDEIYEHGREFHAFGKRARNKRRRDDR